MYPNIIRTYNISFETLSEDGEILSPLGYKFVKSPRGLLPEFADQLFELRSYYKKKMKETDDPIEKQVYDLRQQAIKIILNAGYGVFGYSKFRLFKKEVAETIPAYGRELLKFLIDKVEKENWLKVLYGDTDSIFVKFDDGLNKQELLSRAEELLDRLNSSLNEFAERWNVSEHYHELEMKMIFDRIAFFGVKKRYAGHYIWNDGEWVQGIERKGLEVVRSDTANITKIALDRVLEMVLVEGKTVREALDYIEELKQKIVRGEIPIQDLVYKVSYNPDKEYKVETPFLRGLRFAQKLGVVDSVVGEKLAWIYIVGKESDTIAVPESKIEILKHLPVQIDLKRNFDRWFGNIQELLKKLRRHITLLEF